MSDECKTRDGFPDDLVFDILTRIPAKDVLRYRCVCKRWKEITSTQDFMDFHLQRCMPIVLIEDPRANKFILDKWWEPPRKRSDIHKHIFGIYPGCSICFSLDGLIVMDTVKDFLDRRFALEYIIVNTITREEVRVIAEREMNAIFFHPCLNEWCALFQLPEDHGQQYKVLNLGHNPCWRDVKGPWNDKTIVNGAFPVRVNDFIYFKVGELGNECDEFILVFDIRTEELSILAHPGPRRSTNCDHWDMNLLNINNVLALAIVRPTKNSFDVTIWRLKDVTNKIWTTADYTFHGYIGSIPTAIAAVDEHLLIEDDYKLYVCNLMQGTTRRFGKNYKYPSKPDEDFAPTIFFPRVMSIASLRKCMPVINMLGEKENDKREEQ